MTRKDDQGPRGMFFIGELGAPMILIDVVTGDTPDGLGDFDLTSLFGALRDIDPEYAHLVRFDSAHYNYDVVGDFPLHLIPDLAIASRFYAAVSTPRALSRLEETCRAKGFVRPETPIQEILLKETGFKPRESQIVVAEQMTRMTLDALFKTLVERGEYVALPVPSWHFWDLPGCQTGRYSMLPFDALTEDQLVANFNRVAAKRNVRALLLTSPSVPLMQKLSEGAGREIDRIALHHGIDVIIDDVLRGVQPIGQRRSIGEYFSKPFVIEGFSKRFGDNPLGNLSYVLLPDGEQRDRFAPLSQENRFPYLFGTVLQAAYTYSSQPAIKELRDRNLAFDKAFRAACPDVVITRPSDTHLTTLLELPSTSRMDASSVSHALFHDGLCVMDMNDFYPKGYTQPAIGKEYLRTTIGTMPLRLVGENASLLGRRIRYHMMGGR